MIRPGVAVVRLGARGRGQVIRIDGDTCEVAWRQGRTHERHPLSELAWLGLKASDSRWPGGAGGRPWKARGCPRAVAG
jgi:hypothetical protein